MEVRQGDEVGAGRVAYRGLTAADERDALMDMRAKDVDLDGFLAFGNRFVSAIEGGTIKPVFRPDGSGFCFIEGGPGTATVWSVEPSTGAKQPLVDVERLRKTLEAEFRHPLPFESVPFDRFSFRDATTIRFDVERQPTGLFDPKVLEGLYPDAPRWVVDLDLETYEVTQVPPAERLRMRRATPRNIRKGLLASDLGPDEVASPDGRWMLGEQGPDLAMRAVDDDRVVALTDDGEEDHRWDAQGASWSPDSLRVAATRVDTRACERVPVVAWLKPTEQVQTHPIMRAGGPGMAMSAAIVHVRRGTIVVPELPGEHDQRVTPAGWRKDGKEAYFITTDRRQHYLRLFAVDAWSGEARLVCEETSDTFVYGIRAVDRFAPELILADDARLLWYSQRDGWRHLYLYDTEGRELGRVTEGEFEVLKVVTVDLASETVFFTAHSDTDRPYDVHLCRAKLDGTGFAQLTAASGVHAPIPAPGASYFLDTHSAGDRAPATDLVSSDGEVVASLTTADVSGLEELGIVAPEPFTVTAADGETELHGVLYRPPGFDPSKRYPVIEDIYGGPQVAVHQVGFADPRGTQSMAKASLGFVVYTVDGRGTPERGKAFQDVVYGRFSEFHVEDHRHVLEQLLERHPFMDPDRVGVTGGSWGGYNTVRSLLLAPDRYHVGVAVCPVYDLEDHLGGALEPYMGLPEDRPEAFAQGNSLAIVDRLEGELLMIHGTSDLNATFSATMKMCEALARADKPYHLVVMPDADHHFNNAGDHHGRYYQSSVIRFFIEHLGPELPA
ncbi:MAG TPA: DPP IV N-terminal domain-containing protein [Nitriliruptorales bacterium]